MQIQAKYDYHSFLSQQNTRNSVKELFTNN